MYEYWEVSTECCPHLHTLPLTSSLLHQLLWLCGHHLPILALLCDVCVSPSMHKLPYLLVQWLGTLHWAAAIHAQVSLRYTESAFAPHHVVQWWSLWQHIAHKLCHLLSRHVKLRVVDMHDLSRGMPFENSPLLSSSNKKHGLMAISFTCWWSGGMEVYGWTWTLLTHDLAPLLEHEFVMQWDCYSTSPIISVVQEAHH